MLLQQFIFSGKKNDVQISKRRPAKRVVTRLIGRRGLSHWLGSATFDEGKNARRATGTADDGKWADHDHGARCGQAFEVAQ